MNKLQTKNSLSKISPREKKLYSFIESHPGSQSGEVAEKLDIPLPTVKRILMDIVGKRLIVKHGVGKGTKLYRRNHKFCKKVSDVPF